MRGRGAGVSSSNALQRIRTANRNLYDSNKLMSAPLPLQKPGQIYQGGAGRKMRMRKRQYGGAAVVDKYGAYLPVPVNL